MGGERAPDEIVRGAALASLETADDLEIIVVGDTARIGKTLSEARHDAERLRIHHAGDAVRIGERASEALAARPDASINVAADLVAQGEADAVISAGPQAAAMRACSRRFRRLAGAVPAMAGVYPTEMRRGAKDDPFALILDVGARLDVSAHDMVCFALMGAAYASKISKNPRPRVALLGAGELDEDGGPRVVDEAHELLLRHTGLNFIGRIEATDIPHGIADVVVCSGYAGHLVVSLLEGVGETVLALARYAYKDKLLWRAALGMLSGGIGRLKRLTDWQEYGGAPLLGYEKLLVRAHPSAGERAIANAIKVSAKAITSGLNDEIRARLAELEARLPAA
jgi:phosphate acyltransferase